MTASSLLIRRARILLPDDNFLLGDVYIRDGLIVQVAAEITPESLSDVSANVREIDPTASLYCQA